MPRAAFFSGRKLLLLLALGAVFMSGAWWWAQPPPEPVYHGQRLSEWLDGPLGEYENPPLLAEELHGFGPGALPWLIYSAEHGRYPIYHPKALPFDHAPAGLRRLVPEEWGGYREPLTHQDPMCTLRALDLLGPEAAPAIPALVRVLERMNRAAEHGSQGSEIMLADHAASALLHIGPAAQPTVRQILKNGNPYSRFALLSMLPIRLGTTAQPAPEADVEEVMAILDQACGDPQAPVRLGAVAGIGWCWEKRPDLLRLDAAIPHVTRLLADPDELVRSFAHALGNCGLKAEAAIPRLIEMLDDKSGHVRGAAAETLGKLDGNEKRSAARLRVMVQGADRRGATIAAKALQALGVSPTEEGASGEALPVR